MIKWMKPNMGGIDKGVRVIAAAAALGLGYYYQSYWGLIGLVPVFTILINWCPLYAPFGITTRLEPTVEDEL
jgi:hypothetical protein